MQARLTEIMSSVQGEGLWIGARQVFVRFNGCNLYCDYCDTPTGQEFQTDCIWRRITGRIQPYEIVPNPVKLETLLSMIRSYECSWVSLTGGEPLLWPDYVEALARKLKTGGYKILLETNGVLPDALPQIIPYLDWVSMDYKLAGSAGQDCSVQHQAFMEIVREKLGNIKIVVTRNSQEDEVLAALEHIARCDMGWPVILQPATGDWPPMEKLLLWQERALSWLNDVRILPQLHPVLGLI